jgi:hypothetical protein
VIFYIITIGVDFNLKFLTTSRLFDTIYELSFRSKDRMYAAIAYVGKNAYQLFHENIRKVEDVKFVVNFSENSVRNGSTNPAGVSQLQDFAEVRNKEDLHAKVYIFDDVALVCSANLSRNATSNVEAGILVLEREEIRTIRGFFRDMWNRADSIDSKVFSERLEAWSKSKRKRVGHGIPESPDVFRRPRIKFKPWKSPIPPRTVSAIVFSVGRRNRVGMDKMWYHRRDVELHKKIVDENGAVFWSVGWERLYSKEPTNGYMYITQESTVKYRLKIEKIVRNTELTSKDRKFIPNCRKKWIRKTPTWIKITDIQKLKEPINPTSMKKFKNHEPIKSASALQSGVKIVDEFWE